MSNQLDKVYTPHWAIKKVLDNFPINGKVLEPFAGDGRWVVQMASRGQPVSWCEIDEGRDFLDWHQRVDWIVTNPPYSTFTEMSRKCMAIASQVVLVIPVNKVMSSMPRLRDISERGFAVREIQILGSGRELGFPFGFPVGAVWLSKGWNEKVRLTLPGAEAKVMI